MGDCRSIEAWQSSFFCLKKKNEDGYSEPKDDFFTRANPVAEASRN